MHKCKCLSAKKVNALVQDARQHHSESCIFFFFFWAELEEQNEQYLNEGKMRCNKNG